MLLEVHTHVSPYRPADVSSRHEWLVASPVLRAISSVGRAPRSHRGGHGIEARIAHSSRKCSPRCAESPTLRTWPDVIVRDVLSPLRWVTGLIRLGLWCGLTCRPTQQQLVFVCNMQNGLPLPRVGRLMTVEILR